MPNKHPKPLDTRRRAAGYMLVLGAAMLITVIGYASVMTARFNTRMVAGTNDWARAGALAIGAAELAPLVLEEKPDWRTDLTSGIPVRFKIDGQAVNVIFVDEDDGDFTTGTYDPVRAYGMATVGDAVRVRSVLLTPNTNVPMTCLEVAAHSASGFTGLTATLTSNQIISTAASFTGALVTINADVEYAGTLAGVTVNGTQTKTTEPRTMPDPASVFEYYINHGTIIPLDSLPMFDGDRAIDEAVLTPISNPYTGELNPEGIYVIDCEGGIVTVRNSRIEGTIVLLNAEANDMADHCKVVGQVTWKPAIPNYPAALVQGNFDFAFDGGVMMSESVIGVNLNPVGTPYNGAEDAALDDEYPSRIQGIVYATSGTGFLSNTPYLEGVWLSGEMFGAIGNSNGTINFSKRYYQEPPPGFGAGPYEPVVGTWRWDEAPCGSRNSTCTDDSECCSGNCDEIAKKCRKFVEVVDLGLK
ncbi:MAG: hypothetical protein DHS20C16_31170 [Phycisphaerae bacterium]|nr:MAG: hypothetical protein DHS20C16_31170 [Phycisphaerae bacterium]